MATRTSVAGTNFQGGEILDLLQRLDRIAAVDDGARQWLSEFRSDASWRTAEEIFSALRSLQMHEIQKGLQVLIQVDHRLSQAHDLPASVVLLLRRWYFSALAYYHYLTNELQLAKEDLCLAQEAVRTAIQLHDFLIIFATHCIDFRLQRARIARRENDWGEVRRQIQAIRDIYSNKLDLCTLEDGRAIHFSDFCSFLSTLSLNVYESAEDASFEWLDRLEEQIYMLPDFVIPYP
jgi:hypothetical protein